MNSDSLLEHLPKLQLHLGRLKKEIMEKTYAMLPNRVKAALIDSIVLVAFMYRISFPTISRNEKKQLYKSENLFLAKYDRRSYNAVK